MTVRPVADVLAVLSEETADLTEIAARFDQIIPSVMAQLPQGGGAPLRELQGIDTLHQYLRETSQALSRMAALVDPDAMIDAEVLSDQAHLDHFKSRLRGGDRTTDPAPQADHTHLF